VAVRDLVLYPDDRLRVTCPDVQDVKAPHIQSLITDMVDTMYDAPGVGLAAPQVAELVRVIVIDTREPEEETPQLHVLVNPVIVEREGQITWEEGCLSIPGVFSEVRRSQRIRVQAIDRHGEPFELEATDLLAVCIQHEIDHLNGVLFLDHLSRLKLRMALKTYKRTLPNHLEEMEKKRAKADGVEIDTPVELERAEA